MILQVSTYALEPFEVLSGDPAVLGSGRGRVSASRIIHPAPLNGASPPAQEDNKSPRSRRDSFFSQLGICLHTQRALQRQPTWYGGVAQTPGNSHLASLPPRGRPEAPEGFLHSSQGPRCQNIGGHQRVAETKWKSRGHSRGTG